MSSKKVAEIVVQTLEAAGVRHCYGIEIGRAHV